MKGEKKSKSSHLDKSDQFRTEVESKMIDMDGPELLQFAMIFVQGAMKKSQVWQKFAGTHFSRREAAVPEHTIFPQEKVCEELLQLLTLTNVRDNSLSEKYFLVPILTRKFKRPVDRRNVWLEIIERLIK